MNEADEGFEAAKSIFLTIKGLLEFIGVHIPVIVFCCHGKEGDQTHVLSEPEPLAQEYKEAIRKITEQHGGITRKVERVRRRCTNAPDITWPSSNN